MKLTDLFAPLERLIEEHGSSTIQAKHIALLREQLSVLKERFAEALRETTALQTEKEHLEAENKDVRAKLDKLKQPPAMPRSGSQPRIKGRMEQ